MVSNKANENAKIFAENLSYYMKLHRVDRVMLANELNFKYTTVCDWCNGKVIPRTNKIDILAQYFNIKRADLIDKDAKLSDKNINKTREILVYKDFPTNITFDKDKEIEYLWDSVELPTLYGNVDNYFGYIIFDDITNYGKHIFPGDTIVLKKDDKITKKDAFYLIKLSKGKPFLVYLIESEENYVFLPLITNSKINNKPITFSKENINIKIIGIVKYSTRSL